MRTYDSTPPVELMHASNALAKLKKEEKRAKQEGRPVSGATSGGEDEDPETPAEVKTVMEMKATVTVSSPRIAHVPIENVFLTSVLATMCTDWRHERASKAQFV